MYMMEQRYTEQDWRLFRSRLPQWQEAFMDKLTREYLAILTADGAASDKFWELEKRLKRDVRCVGVCAEMRRSKLIWNLIALLNEGAIVRSDLDGFSNGLLEALEYYIKANE